MGLKLSNLVLKEWRDEEDLMWRGREFQREEVDRTNEFAWAWVFEKRIIRVKKSYEQMGW